MDTRYGRDSGAGTIDDGLVNADLESSYWRENWRSRPYSSDMYTYDDYAPAYRAGWEAYGRHGSSGKSFDDIERDLRSDWDRQRGTSRLGWEHAQVAMRDAWDRVKQGLGIASQSPSGAQGDVGGGSGSIGGTGSSSMDAGGIGTRGMAQGSQQQQKLGGDDCCGPMAAGCSTSTGASSLGGVSMSDASLGGSSGAGRTGRNATAGGSLLGGSVDSGSSLADEGASIPGGTGAGLSDEVTGGGASGIGGVGGSGDYRSGDGFNYGYAGVSTSGSSLDDGGVQDDISYLNSFLRGEISAAETYRQAIMRLGGHFPQLADGLSSHEKRVVLLQERVRALGGDPSTGSGVWGAWAKLLQGAADLFGERSAIAALERGEDHGRDDYRRELDNLSAATRSWVQRELLGEQERTHALLSDLKHAHV